MGQRLPGEAFLERINELAASVLCHLSAEERLCLIKAS